VIPLLDLASTHGLVLPLIQNGTWQKDPVTGALLNQTLPTVSVDFEYLGHVTWGTDVQNSYSQLQSNCWGALTTVAPWLATKYGMVGCNITVSNVQMHAIVVCIALLGYACVQVQLHMHSRADSQAMSYLLSTSRAST
jgi:hypothetical protein